MRSTAELDLRLGVDWRLSTEFSTDKAGLAEAGRRCAPLAKDVLAGLSGVRFILATALARSLSSALVTSLLAA